MTDSAPSSCASARRHDWLSLRERKIPACEAPDGCDRTEKTCGACRIVKITVHPPTGFPFRKWRLSTGQEFQVNGTPPCEPRPPSLSVAAETTSEVIFR